MDLLVLWVETILRPRLKSFLLEQECVLQRLNWPERYMHSTTSLRNESMRQWATHITLLQIEWSMDVCIGSGLFPTIKVESNSVLLRMMTHWYWLQFDTVKDIMYTLHTQRTTHILVCCKYAHMDTPHYLYVSRDAENIKYSCKHTDKFWSKPYHYSTIVKPCHLLSHPNRSFDPCVMDLEPVSYSF